MRNILKGPYLQLWTFGIFTIGGCFLVWFGKLYGLTVGWSLAIPVILMISFMLLSMLFGKLRMHDEQTGDNLYYMGFLFTLTSLGASLYNFGSGTAIDEVVRNFGVAISSTIAGIALRILYNQMRRDPGDIERAARSELSDMTRRVRGEMESVRREFSDFRRVTQQALEEAFHELHVQAEKNGQYIRGILEQQSTEAIKPVIEASTRFTDAMNKHYGSIEHHFSQVAGKIEATGEMLDSANVAMSLSSKMLGEQVDLLAAKLERITIPDQVLKDEFAPIATKLLENVSKQSEATSADAERHKQAMKELHELVSKIADASSKSAQTVQTAADISVDQQDRFDKLAEAVEKQGIHISRIAKVVAGKTKAEEGIEVLKQAAELGSQVKIASPQVVSNAKPEVTAGDDRSPFMNVPAPETVAAPTPQPFAGRLTGFFSR